MGTKPSALAQTKHMGPVVINAKQGGAVLETQDSQMPDRSTVTTASSTLRLRPRHML